jgi:hypothetical protein
VSDEFETVLAVMLQRKQQSGAESTPLGMTNRLIGKLVGQQILAGESVG